MYLYRPAEHDLIPVLSGDHRKDTGIQGFVGVAPLNLLFVADLARFNSTNMPVEEQILESHVEAGCQAQNVYLYCASEGLGATIRGSVPREKGGGAAEAQARAEDRRRPDDRLPEAEVETHPNLLPHGARLRGRAWGNLQFLAVISEGRRRVNRGSGRPGRT